MKPHERFAKCQKGFYASELALKLASRSVAEKARQAGRQASRQRIYEASKAQDEGIFARQIKDLR